MIHGILQFTPSIAFCYVLHRCESLDIRCRESFFSSKTTASPRDPVTGPTGGRRFVAFSLALLAPGFVVGSASPPRDAPDRARGARDGAPGASRAVGGRGGGLAPARSAPGGSSDNVFAGRSVDRVDNDPSAGSPTETLLRLLLPLNDKVQWTSRDVAGGGPLTSPRSEHFTGPFNR